VPSIFIIDRSGVVRFRHQGLYLGLQRAWSSTLEVPRFVQPPPDFMGITLFVAKFDTEKVLERSLGITEPGTIEVFKGGARSTAVMQYDTLSGLLKKVIR
jgi:hypothetical protein